jgi:hypothetical protein
MGEGPWAQAVQFKCPRNGFSQSTSNFVEIEISRERF